MSNARVRRLVSYSAIELLSYNALVVSSVATSRARRMVISMRRARAGGR